MPPSGSRSRARRPPHGQHFLADASLRRQILARLNPRPEDTWVEIGAGHGEFTEALTAVSARVVAVERDPQLAAILRQRLARLSNARVVEADILKIDWEGVRQEAGTARLRVFGSLPYYITSPILRKLFEAGEALADAHVIVQREVAERLVAQPGHREYGYLTVLTQLHATPEILQTIPRGAFRPPPKVESALVRLVPPGVRPRLAVRDEQDFLRFLEACFRHKRKTLVNNLRATIGAPAVEAALATLGLGTYARAEELGLLPLAHIFHRTRGVVAPRTP
jgi:16S rRNA (adenine1518-N6/adenine1519-N6)-dimethyltransferase